MKASQIVTELLGEDHWVQQILGEATVHLPTRGKIWVASFYGPKGQQWKSTGSTDKTTALRIAQALEAAARAQSAKPGETIAFTPIMIAAPTDGRNLLLTGVDAHERPRPDERIQRVVIRSDISIQRIGTGHQLKQEWDLVPSPYHSGHQVGPFCSKLLSQFCRRLHL